MPKIEPAVRHLAFQIPAGISYVDLAAELSKVNRRLYRQGYVYAVESFQVILPVGMKATDVASCVVSTIHTRCIHVGSGTATILEIESEWKVDLEGCFTR